MKKYLITGGAGFIGSNFIQYLLTKDKADTNNEGDRNEHGTCMKHNQDISIINLDKLEYSSNLNYLNEVEGLPNYRFIQGDICDETLVESILQEGIDYIIHFAAMTHVDNSIKSSKEFVLNNVEGTRTLLDKAVEVWTKEGTLNKKKFLYVSTDEVYGKIADGELFKETTPVAPRNPYSASKAGGEHMVMAYHNTYEIPVLITRCSNNYGKNQHTEKLLPKLIMNCKEHKKLPIYGDGKAIRDWLYVEDHCSGINMVLQSGRIGEVYNIGGHNEMTTLEIVHYVINYIQKNYDSTVTKELIEYVEDRKGHDRRYAIDSSKIQTELGWKANITFYEGMKQTIDYYMKR